MLARIARHSRLYPCVIGRLIAAALLLATVACDSGPTGPGGGLVLSALPPDTCHAGQPLAHSLQAKVTDQGGKPASAVTVAFALSSGTGTLGANSAKTDAGGIAQVGFTCGPTGADWAGNPQLVASVQASLAGATGSPAQFSVLGLWGPLARFATTNPRVGHAFSDDSMPVVLPTAFTFQVFPVDQFGNGVKLSTVEWTPTPGSGSFAASTTSASVAGTSNTWSPGPQPGIQSVVLSTPEFPAVRNTLVVRALAAPLQVQIISPSFPITATVGVIFPQAIVVRVTTADGEPFLSGQVVLAANVQVVMPVTGHFTAPPCTDAGGSEQPFFRTDATGIASACFMPGTLAGPLGVDVHVFGGNGSASASIMLELTLAPGAPAKAVSVFGNGQAGTVGGTLGIPLGFTLQDGYGNKVPNQTVTWTVIAGGGSMASPTTTTDAAGGTSNAWTLGPTVGTQTVTAKAGAVTVTFTAQAS